MRVNYGNKEVVELQQTDLCCCPALCWCRQQTTSSESLFSDPWRSHIQTKWTGSKPYQVRAYYSTSILWTEAVGVWATTNRTNLLSSCILHDHISYAAFNLSCMNKCYDDELMSSTLTRQINRVILYSDTWQSQVNVQTKWTESWLCSVMLSQTIQDLRQSLSRFGYRPWNNMFPVFKMNVLAAFH